MWPPSCMRSVVDRNVVMRCIPVHSKGRGATRFNLWFVRCDAMGRRSDPAGAAEFGSRSFIRDSKTERSQHEVWVTSLVQPPPAPRPQFTNSREAMFCYRRACSVATFPIIRRYYARCVGDLLRSVSPAVRLNSRNQTWRHTTPIYSQFDIN